MRFRNLRLSGIWNTARGIPNPINDWNLESKFHRQSPESSTWNPESTAWNPESNTVLDFLTWGEKWSVKYRIGSVKCDPPRRVTLLAKPTFYRFLVVCFLFFSCKRLPRFVRQSMKIWLTRVAGDPSTPNTFLGNCPPNPLLRQHFVLSETDIEQQTRISEIHNDERKDPHQKTN